MSPRGVSVNGTREDQCGRSLTDRRTYGFALHFQSSNKETIAGVPRNRTLCDASCQGIVALEEARQSKGFAAGVDPLTRRAGMLGASLLFASPGHDARWQKGLPCRVALPPGSRPTDPCSTAVGMRAYSTPVLNHQLGKHRSIE